MRLEVEYSAREIDHDEYTREHWRDEDLKPMANGRVFFWLGQGMCITIPCRVIV
jgi:hypothetical protein